MNVVKKNVEAAIEICKILSEKECTIADVPGILSYVDMKLRSNTMVPKADYYEMFKELLGECEEVSP